MMKFRPKQAEKNFNKNKKTSFTLGRLHIAGEVIEVKGWIETCDRYSRLKNGVKLIIYMERERRFENQRLSSDVTNFFRFEFSTFQDAYIAAFDVAANMRVE